MDFCTIEKENWKPAGHKISFIRTRRRIICSFPLSDLCIFALACYAIFLFAPVLCASFFFVECVGSNTFVHRKGEALKLVFHKISTTKKPICKIMLSRNSYFLTI